jgi:predicted membrane-bound spermidine synthase
MARDLTSARAASGVGGVLLFASGAAALLYQVVWVKQLSLVVGVDVHAVTIGVGAFFAGLALGGIGLGRIADRSVRPFRLFALLELATAVLGVAATLALAEAAPLFARLEARAGAVAWILVWVLVGIPAVAMGGTLPVLTRAVVASASGIGAAGGRLYAANTAGAIAGALASAFALLPWLGVRGTAVAAAAINATAALGALAVDRSAAASAPPPVSAGGARAPAGARLALALYAGAGAVALGYEVVWSQAVVPFMSTRSFAFAVVLATYLAGLAIGGALYAGLAGRLRDAWGVFGLLIAAAGLVAVIEIAALGRWLIVAQTWAELGTLTLTASPLAGMSSRFVVAAAWIVLLPTILLGAAFPAALRLVVGPGRVGRDVGAVIALNTVGGIGGAVLTGFVLVPRLGLVHTLAVLAGGAALIGLAAVVGRTGVRPAARWATVAAALGIGLTALATPWDRLATARPGAAAGTLVFYREGAGGTVAVVETPGGPSRFRRLYIQGVSNSGDAMPSLRYMRLQALLPLLVHRREPRSAMVIGLGTGITAGALLQYSGLQRTVCAELLPAVVSAAPLFAGNLGAASDPRLEIRLRDGRRELLSSAERYDLITLEPPPPSAAGVANLYSTDFYALAARRLAPGGVLAQWWPLAAQNDEDSRSLVRSFLDRFPHASLWTTELHEMLLIGSLEPMELDPARVTERFGRPAVAAALRAVGVTSSAALLATWVTDRAGLERYAGDAAPVTDDRPRIEYAPWVRSGEITRVLPRLLALSTAPPLGSADPGFRAAVAEERERLWRFYRAGLLAYDRDAVGSTRELRRVLAEDADNPYYRWFATGARS